MSQSSSITQGKFFSLSNTIFSSVFSSRSSGPDYCRAQLWSRVIRGCSTSCDGLLTIVLVTWGRTLHRVHLCFRFKWPSKFKVFELEFIPVAPNTNVRVMSRPSAGLCYAPARRMTSFATSISIRNISCCKTRLQQNEDCFTVTNPAPILLTTQGSVWQSTTYLGK